MIALVKIGLDYDKHRIRVKEFSSLVDLLQKSR